MSNIHAPRHVVLVGTKPDIIKQAPVYHELKARGHDAVVCHTGQHFDHNLSGSMLEEFAITDLVNLRAAGSGTDLISRTVDRLGWYLNDVAESGTPPILYVHGDTSTAMSGSLAAFALRQGLVHVEAGLRTLSPRKDVLHNWIDGATNKTLDWSRFAVESMDRANYERGSREPSPEQFNTRVADAGSHFQAAPVELNRQYLLDEGFAPQTIEVVGNSVVDALEQRHESGETSILDTYPQLASGEFIRYCVHRQENTNDQRRFDALMRGLEQLLEDGHKIVFIRLNGTEAAIDRYGYREWLNKLVDRHQDRLITGGVWPNYSHVLEAMKLCAVVATDSGSIQEEVNVLGVPCVTLRFGSDRGESLLAGGNFLAPPVSAECIAGVIDTVYRNRTDLKWERVYPRHASRMLVEAVERRLGDGNSLNFSEEWRYGLD